MIGNRILVLSPHMDDGVISSFGLLSRYILNGKDIFYVSFSFAENSLQPDVPRDAPKKELYESLAFLPIEKEHIITFDYSVRFFAESRQQILESLVKMKREIQPDTIIMPSMNDLHQDHQTIANEGFRAFKTETILGYEAPRNMVDASPRLFVRLTEVEMMKKLKALEVYESQKWRFSFIKFTESLNRMRGLQVGAEYAESFEVIRCII